MRTTLARPRYALQSQARPKPKTRKAKHHGLSSNNDGPHYKVVLLNDRINTMQHVKQVLVRTFHDMHDHEAEDKMRTAHYTGSAVLRVLAQEQAEERCEQLRRSSLLSTIEPA